MIKVKGLKIMEDEIQSQIIQSLRLRDRQASRGVVEVAKYYLCLDGFTPTSVNRLMFAPVRRRIHLMRGDKELIAHYAREQNIPKATGPRRISLQITLGKGQRRLDPSNVWKSLEDALVAAGLLIGDSDRWVVHGSVDWDRGERRTVIVLEDMENLIIS